MEYQTFALRWRPQTFDEVVGQEHITTTLKNAIRQNRIAHAYLFAGPRGTGKTSTARILAKALNCKEGPKPEPCNKCENCKEITASNSLDVLEIDGASNRGIDEIRALKENVKLSPSSSRYKIYIIDEVHMLTEEAFNALLKTLEEPPEHVKFIFATTRPQKILPTILSRCQRFDFRRIPTKDIVERLKEISKKEKLRVDEDALYLIAKSADGSLRDAESILDQFSSYENKGVTKEDVNSILGSVGQEFLFNMMQKIIDKDTKGTLGLLNEAINKGKDLSIFVSEFIEHIRNMMIAKETDNYKELIDASDESLKTIKRQSEQFSGEDLLYIFSLFSKIQSEMESYPIKRIPIEMVLIKLTREGGIVKIGDLIEELKKLTNTSIDIEERPKSVVKLKDNPADLEISPDNPDENNNLNQEEFKSIWQKACQRIKEIKTPVGLYISEGKPVRLEGNLLTIGFYPGFSFHKENLEDEANRKIVEDTFSNLLNKKMKVNFIDFPKKPTDEQKKTTQESTRRDNPQPKTNPIIDSAIKLFDGLIIKKEDRIRE